MLTCFLDNDVILKLSAFDLFDETLSILNLSWQQLQVVSSAQYTFRGKRYINQYSEPVCQKAIAIARQCQIVTVESISEFALLNGVKKIDAGEAELIAATANREVFWLVTGDKNCLEALATAPNLESICNRLRGRTICLEQLIYKLIELKGFTWVQERIIVGQECDRAIKIIFGWSEPASEATVLEGLQSYINDVQLRSQGLLANL
ncbi:hypothetical protein V2H45_02975 [Tumidithrix elongata RA019]|uniref:PIN domain-containing protein n=1 Tax=Tumidithrix elongata BACA0141 TaxID=2716417 RepID=A0AAW9PWR3_9CYAN|nr:hypothetical protein [Tumidithrix elongata RA019]